MSHENQLIWQLMKRMTLIFLITISALHVIHGQDFLSWKMNDRYFSGQVNFGFASYRGELKHNGSIQNEISNVSLGLEARLLNRWATRIEIGRYNIRGHDKHAPDSSFARQRNLSFTSVNYEASLQAIFFLKNYKGDYYKRHKVDPYLFAGIGTTYFSPMAEYNGDQFKLYEFQTEETAYNQWTMTIPFGAGLKWRITPFMNFNTELTYRFTFTDYLDDVSGNYPTAYPDLITEQLSNRKNEIDIINQTAYDQLISGQSRGDNSYKDAYLFINFKFEFFLDPGLFSGKKKDTSSKPGGY